MRTRTAIQWAMVVLGSFSSTVIHAQSNQQANTIKTTDQMDYKVNIGKITVPKTSVEAFKKQVGVTPAFLKTLAGYVDGDYFETVDETGNLHMVSVVTWQNESSYKNAQLELKKYYERINFDRMEFVKRLNIDVEYSAYDVVQMK